MINQIDKKYFKMAVGSDRIKHESSCDIQCRCPICGDSAKSKNKARLHLYSKNGETRVNCFNECSVHNRTMYGFLKDFYPSLLSSYAQETFGERLNELKLDSMNLAGDFDIQKPKETPNSDVLEKPPVLFDISKFLYNEKCAYEYVESRGLEWSPNLGEIFIAKDNLTIDGKFFPIKGFIIIPFYCCGKMYGFYSRSLTEHKFFTYMPQKNLSWKIWNYFNIDKSKPVYVFEGIFDALTAYNNGFENVVACCGATPPIERFSDLEVVLCLDNDLTGKNNTIKLLQKYPFKALCYDGISEKDLNDMAKNHVDVQKLLTYNAVSGINGIIRIQNTM